jgi:hypothetical protein
LVCGLGRAVKAAICLATTSIQSHTQMAKYYSSRKIIDPFLWGRGLSVEAEVLAYVAVVQDTLVCTDSCWSHVEKTIVSLVAFEVNKSYFFNSNFFITSHLLIDFLIDNSVTSLFITEFLRLKKIFEIWLSVSNWIYIGCKFISLVCVKDIHIFVF